MPESTIGSRERGRIPIRGVKSIGLFPSNAPPAREAAADLSAWLVARGLKVLVPSEFLSKHPGLLDPACAPMQPNGAADTDLVVALGGDGTLLRAAREVVAFEVPVLGVNLGTLGFLSAYGASEAVTAMEAVLDDRLESESRLCIRVVVRRGDAIVDAQLACNDAYLKHGARPRMLDLETSVAGHKMANYRADGLIVATPMGSTAYNLAAGGPIVNAGTEVVTITPICPHSLTHRPVVTSAEGPISIRFCGPSAPASATLSVDGQWSVPLESGDEIEITKAPQQLQLVPPRATVFEVLRHKLGWSTT